MSGLPQTKDVAPAKYVLEEWLRHRRLLLEEDNCLLRQDFARLERFYLGLEVGLGFDFRFWQR
jgi:hypothetical protein